MLRVKNLTVTILLFPIFFKLLDYLPTYFIYLDFKYQVRT